MKKVVTWGVIIIILAFIGYSIVDSHITTTQKEKNTERAYQELNDSIKNVKKNLLLKYHAANWDFIKDNSDYRYTYKYQEKITDKKQLIGFEGEIADIIKDENINDNLDDPLNLFTHSHNGYILKISKGRFEVDNYIVSMKIDSLQLSKIIQSKNTVGLFVINIQKMTKVDIEITHLDEDYNIELIGVKDNIEPPIYIFKGVLVDFALTE